jgi:hypothetical protein
LPDVKITYVQSVSEGADAERVLTQVARSGHKVIFATSYGYIDWYRPEMTDRDRLPCSHSGMAEMGEGMRR